MRESSKKKDKRTKKERQEQRIIDLLTVKGSDSIVTMGPIISYLTHRERDTVILREYKCGASQESFFPFPLSVESK